MSRTGTSQDLAGSHGCWEPVFGASSHLIGAFARVNIAQYPGAIRVGEEVAPLTPHRSGRAQLRHPVPHRADSLTVWRNDEQSEAAVTEIG
jgi:hypothetical protein